LHFTPWAFAPHEKPAQPILPQAPLPPEVFWKVTPNELELKKELFCVALNPFAEHLFFGPEALV
jgi:hypothetical protein